MPVNEQLTTDHDPNAPTPSEIIESRRGKIADINLINADLKHLRAQGGDFSGARLNGANLQEADLSQASCRKTSFVEAYCGGANFEDADLTGADLAFADCSFANFNGANLNGADLATADLDHATFYKANVVGAKINIPPGDLAALIQFGMVYINPNSDRKLKLGTVVDLNQDEN